MASGVTGGGGGVSPEAALASQKASGDQTEAFAKAAQEEEAEHSAAMSSLRKSVA